MQTPDGIRIVKLTAEELDGKDGNRIYSVEAIKIESSTSIWVAASLKHELKSISTPYAELDKSLANPGQQVKNESVASIWVAENLKHDGFESKSTPYADRVKSLADAACN
jgi:hypothetical protein